VSLVDIDSYCERLSSSPSSSDVDESVDDDDELVDDDGGESEDDDSSVHGDEVPEDEGEEEICSAVNILPRLRTQNPLRKFHELDEEVQRRRSLGM
jgi:hypothetical protein